MRTPRRLGAFSMSLCPSPDRRLYMNPLSILLLGFAMSTDAFAAAIGKGAAMSRPRLLQALQAGLIFGVIEAITPVIGWLLGLTASSFIKHWDHWVAFGLLGLLGLHMIYNGLKPESHEQPPEAKARKHGVLALALTGVSTSIDALAVGVSLAFVNTPIAVIALVIGLCTCTMVTLGIMLGRLMGEIVGRRAEIIGGVILIGVGSAILYEHLSA